MRPLSPQPASPFVLLAHELTAPADSGGGAMVGPWWTQEVRHALCPGCRGAHDESARGTVAGPQWQADVVAGRGDLGVAAPHAAALAPALPVPRLRRAVGSTAAAALAPPRPGGGGRAHRASVPRAVCGG